MLNKVKQAGFTLFELFITFIGLTGVALTILLVWAAIHFIAKFW